MYKDLKVVFMGTPSFGEKTLEYLIKETTVVLVVTQPDKMVGRKKEIMFSHIKNIAIKNNINIFQPEKIKIEYEEIKKYNPDLIITAAYGQIVPLEVLNIPKLGCINLHGSILPKYRGAAPIQWSIINNEKTTGVSLMYMDEAMDTGDVIDIKKIDILNSDNYKTLYEKLGLCAKEVLEKNLESIKNGTNKKVTQNNELATYARMLRREDEFINFNDDVISVYKHIMGVYPNGYINILGKEIKLLDVSYEKKNVKDFGLITDANKDKLSISAKDGIINLLTIKPSGKNEMPIKVYLNGINKELLKKSKINM